MYNMKFIGYHGTNSEHIDYIVKNGYILSGKKEWFGEGIYFFEDLAPLTYGFVEAESWAVVVKHFKRWAVFQAEIESDIIIDLLLNDDHKKLFRKIRKRLLKLHKESGKDLNEFSDRVVYNLIAKEKEVELIRVPVDAGKFCGYHSPSILRFQIQICVKKSECVKKNILYKRG